jgi:AraC family transcriptional regulator of adaptative response / DNA-3-methyladenine glycosylase II
VIDVAFASNSLRRCNVRPNQYRLNPTQFRGCGRREKGSLRRAGLPPAVRLEAMLQFLAARLFAGAEAIRDSSYLRTVSIAGRTGWIRVRPSAKRHALAVEVAPGLGRSIPSVLRRVRHLFDLGAEPQRIAQRLGKLAAKRPGLRLPGAFDGYEVAVRAVLAGRSASGGDRSPAASLAHSASR